MMEVVSDGDEDHRRDRETKRDEYAKAGIPEYWIVDPELGQITRPDARRPIYAVLGEFSARRASDVEALAWFCGRRDVGPDGEAVSG